VAKLYRLFVGELGGSGCVQAIRSALLDSLTRRGVDTASVDPWFFPTSVQYEELLTRHGIVVKSLDLFPRPTLLPCDIAGWLEIFAQPFFVAFGDQDRCEVIEEILLPRCT